MRHFVSVAFLSCAVILLSPLSLYAQPVYGLSGFRPVYRSGANDLIGIRFRFNVIENESQSLRLIFGSHRLHAPGTAMNYIVETNVYSGRYGSYTDGSCTTWPMLGTYIERESSLRLAIPDYAFHFGQQPGITTGIRSNDVTAFPIQTYLIDNIPNLYKSDAISQFNTNNIETLVKFERGDIVTNVSAFDRCGRSLLPRNYRTWTLHIEMPGKPIRNLQFVLPDTVARFLTVTEAMNFASEFLDKAGHFTVHYWDFASIRESDPVWRIDTNFISSASYDGNGTNFGIRVVTVDGRDRVEFSNRSGNTYLPANTHFSIVTPAVTSSGSLWSSPTSFSLNQNFPNPFNPVTHISFTIPSQRFVSLRIFDVLSKEVAVLISGLFPAGQHSTRWDASDFPSGIYYYRLHMDAHVETKKMVLLR